MFSFRDLHDRLWTIELTIAAIRRLKSSLSVDLLNLGEGTPPLAVRLVTDPLFVCEVLFSLLAPRMEEAGVSEDDFAEAMGADQMVAAYTAFAEALENFFQKLGRPELATALRQATQAVRMTALQAEKRIARVNLDQLATQTLNGLSIPGE
jgi:hypothetical protein